MIVHYRNLNLSTANAVLSTELGCLWCIMRIELKELLTYLLTYLLEYLVGVGGSALPLCQHPVKFHISCCTHINFYCLQLWFCTFVKYGEWGKSATSTGHKKGKKAFGSRGASRPLTNRSVPRTPLGSASRAKTPIIDSLLALRARHECLGMGKSKVGNSTVDGVDGVFK